MQPRFTSNQRRQSSINKQQVPKINHKENHLQTKNNSMLCKSLPKNTKSPPISQPISTAIENIEQLISFLNTAKINIQKQSSLIQSLKTYTYLLKEHLKVNLIIAKPQNLNFNKLSQANLHTYSKNNENYQLKNLSNTVLNPLENYSGLFQNKNSLNKIQKKPYFGKGVLPQIKQKSMNFQNMQVQAGKNIKKSQQFDDYMMNKTPQFRKKQFIPNKSERKQQQKKKLPLRLKTESDDPNDDSRVEQKDIEKQNPQQIISKLKQKISCHQLLIQKLKNKVSQFQKVTYNVSDDKGKQNQESLKQQENKRKKEENKGKQDIKLVVQYKIVIQESQNSKEGKLAEPQHTIKDVQSPKEQRNQRNQKEENTVTQQECLNEINFERVKQEIQSLKCQLQSRQQEIIALYSLLNKLNCQ